MKYANFTSSPKLLDQVREKIRVKHYSIRTERAYLDWIKRYILFYHKTHPARLGARDRGVSFPSCDSGKRGGIDTELGEKRFAVFVPRGVGNLLAVAGEHH